ncbi:MAG: VWA domain-containing protein [Candidatus Neomarinimicrobiota bacterium]
MSFHSPLFLFLLIILPVIIFCYWYYSNKIEGTILISSSSLFSKDVRLRGKIKNRILKIFEIIILGLIIVALARPQKVDKLVEKNIDVIDILLVLDISSSMLADDFSPNRLEVVKNTAKDFISSREGDRIGVVVFAGQSFIQCPLTTDIKVLLNLVDEISVAAKDYDGTAIGMAIANATNRLRESESKSKTMILLSDGSNNSGEIEPSTAAKIANEFGIKIYTIAAGTNKSVSRIPGRGLIRNEIDIETLKNISNETGGQFFRATDKVALSNIYQEINNLERSDIEVKDFINYYELYYWLLIPALFLAFIYFLIKNYFFRVAF